MYFIPPKKSERSKVRWLTDQLNCDKAHADDYVGTVSVQLTIHVLKNTSESGKLII